MKIGIITLHRVPNCGSALQAYALQRYIEKISKEYVVKIIDYKFPNVYHLRGIKAKIRYVLRKIYCMFLIRTYRFKYFYHHYYNLTLRSYSSASSLSINSPKYDIYVTGSDQVWNINTLKNDPVMYCSFAALGAKCIAFGASFSIKELPKEYHDEIRKRLSKYSYIGMRESTGVNILNSLRLNPEIKIMNTCDPTLLLSADDYQRIAMDSNISVSKDYILVYYLNYAYNPNPAISIAITKAVENFQCNVIKIGNPGLSYAGKYHSIDSLGPCEFVYLFRNAKYIITSSFHGTMFATIFRKPFVSILPSEEENDSRIKDFLSIIGLSKQGIYNKDQNPSFSFTNPFTPIIESNLNSYIEQSKSFLKEALQAV